MVTHTNKIVPHTVATGLVGYTSCLDVCSRFIYSKTFNEYTTVFLEVSLWREGHVLALSMLFEYHLAGPLVGVLDLSSVDPRGKNFNGQLQTPVMTYGIGAKRIGCQVTSCSSNKINTSQVGTLVRTSSCWRNPLDRKDEGRTYAKLAERTSLDRTWLKSCPLSPFRQRYCSPWPRTLVVIWVREERDASVRRTNTHAWWQRPTAVGLHCTRWRTALRSAQVITSSCCPLSLFQFLVCEMCKNRLLDFQKVQVMAKWGFVLKTRYATPYSIPSCLELLV